MSKALSIPADRQARLLAKALDRLEHTIENGGGTDAMAGIKVVVGLLLPNHKAVTHQVLVAGASDRGQAIALSKVQQRLIQSATDADYEVLAPLPRVQRDE